VPLLSAWRCARNRVCLDGVAEVAASGGVGAAGCTCMHTLATHPLIPQPASDVAQRQRECGAADVRRPALALFRGEWGAVQVDVKERTVAFMGGFATVRSAPRCPLGGKGYYELEK
jgi:hypothetical protein